jgi:hypothetical protein
MWDNQDFLVLVAAGNSGGQGAGSVGSPATAKSTLSVGASLGTASSFQQQGLNPAQICTVPGQPCTESMASFSSLGPLPSDSRLKPEVSAPGALTWSAMSTANDQYQCPTQAGAILTPAQRAGLVFATQGTSMATPTTAGNVALVRQYFTDGWYPSGRVDQGPTPMLPLGSLLKAILMNSAKPMNGKHAAQDLGGPGINSNPQAGTQTKAGIQISRSTPTYSQRNLAGFGLTVLDHTLYFQDTPIGSGPADHDLFAIGEFGQKMLETSVKTGESKTYRFQVRPGLPFKVTLVWTDAPGSTAAQKALVNNLDLQVREAGPINGGGTTGTGTTQTGSGTGTGTQTGTGTGTGTGGTATGIGGTTGGGTGGTGGGGTGNSPATGTLYVPNGFSNAESDEINPFEQVEVYAPTEQVYEVKIVGVQVAQAHPTTQGQPFSLVVTGKFAKTAELYPNAAPIVIPATNQKVIIGRANRWVLQGQRFGATTQDNTVRITCQGAEVPGAIVSSGSPTSVTVELTQQGWQCPGRTMMGVLVTSSGFESAPVQVGNALTEAEAGGVIVGADGVVQVAPATQEEREQTCQSFTNVNNVAINCQAIEFCEYDEKTGQCGAKPDPTVWIVLILILIMLLIGCGYITYKRRESESGVWSVKAKTNLPVARPVVGIPGPPPNKPKGKGNLRPLKAGWNERKDPGSGDTYYYNESSGATTWERNLIEC